MVDRDVDELEVLALRMIRELNARDPREAARFVEELRQAVMRFPDKSQKVIK